MSIVFDDVARDIDGPPKPGGGQFEYLNRSSRAEAERVRMLIDRLIEGYPKRHLESLIPRLRSRKDRDHISAFFELILHEVLLRSEHRVVDVEPTVPNSTRRPDFLIEAPDGHRFYLEAVTSVGESSAAAAATARFNEVKRVVDEADARYHFLDLRTEGTPTGQVTLGRLRRGLAEWIAMLPTTEEARHAPPFIY